MSPDRSGSRRAPWLIALVRRVLAHPTRTPAIAAGLRASVLTTLPIAGAVALGYPPMLWMAIGAWIVTLCDVGGAYATRAVGMVGMTLGGPVVLMVAGAVSGHLALQVPLLLVAGIGFSALSVLGEAGPSLGGSSMVLLAVALGTPGDLRTHGAHALMFASGGAVAALVALSFWRIHPDKPAWKAVSQCLATLADLVVELRRLRGAPAGEWDASARAFPMKGRAAIERAQRTVFATRVGRGARSATCDRLQIVVERADRIFEALAALTVHVEQLGPRSARFDLHLDRSLAHVAGELRRLATATSGQTVPTNDAEPASAAPAADAPAVETEEAAAVARALEAITENLHAAAEALTLSATPLRPPTEGGAELRGTAATAVATLRANLTTDSHAFVHAVRVGLTTAAAMVVAARVSLVHASWAVMTAAMCVQPSNGGTWSRTVQRIGGTVAGALAVVWLTPAVPRPGGTLAVIAVTTFAAVALRPLNYFYFALFVTPAFVFFAELAEGRDDLATARMVDTLLGGALAVVSVSLFWRGADDRRLRVELASAVEKERRLFDLALARVLGGLAALPPPTDRDLAEARRAVGLANNNAEATLQELLALRPSPQHQTLDVLLTAMRRFTATVIALAATPGLPLTPEQTRALRALARRVDDALASVVASLRHEGAPDSAAPAPSSVTPRDLPEPYPSLEHLAEMMRRRAATLDRRGRT